MTHSKFVVAILFSLTLAPLFDAQTVNAQAIPDGANNLPPFGSFNGSDFETVTLQNGNLHISIPILKIPQRGGQPIEYKFLYDTMSWTRTVTNPIPPQTQPTTLTKPDSLYSGWGLTSSLNWAADSASGSTTTVTCPGNAKYNVYGGVAYVDPERRRHPFLIVSTVPPNAPCVQTQLTGPASDASGIWLSANGLTLKDGTQVLSQREDTNGNIAAATADTVNRNLLVVTNGPNITYTSPLGNTITAAQNQTWTYHDPNGAAQVWTVNFQAIDVNAGLCSTNCGIPTTFTTVVPQYLYLPSGSYYQFVWNNNSGEELQQITLPTGGYISYTYSGMLCQSTYTTDTSSSESCRMAVSSRTVNNPASTWKYKIGTPQSLVTDPNANDEVHICTFLSTANCVETEVQNWSGSSQSGAGGTLVKDVKIGYTCDAPPSGANVYLVGANCINVRVVSHNTTLDTMTRGSQTDYDTYTVPFGTISYTSTRSNVTTLREYDYASGSSPGSLLRRTTYAYGLNTNSSYTNLNIVDRVTQATVYDGSGNQLAQTTYEYDNYSHSGLPMVTSNAVQHDSNRGTGYTTRGNVTAISKWRNTDGVLLTTTNQYDDAGNVLSTVDPKGSVTSFDFTDSWSNAACAPSGQGKAYITKITNALGQSTKRTYSSCTGLLGSITDPNNQLTSIAHDLLSRPTTESYPNGGVTSFCYTDVGGSTCTKTGPPYSVVKTLAITSSPAVNEITTTTFDGVGLLSQIQVNSDPDGASYTLITYDKLLRKYQTYNPTRCSPITSNCGESTWGYATTNHDAIGRVSSVVEQDGSTGSISYAGNCTTTTDEALNSRKSCVDGLGRVANVWEDPGSSPHFNYETDYTYDALDNLTNVNQKGSDSTKARVRSFLYDSLSQLTSATNPESGTLQYVYDANGNLATKTAPSPNQPSTGTATVTTTYSYDALNRLTRKSYNDTYSQNTPTPSAFFYYDEPSIWGVSPGNPIGRRTHEAAANGTTGNVFSYDAIGRVVGTWPSTPTNAGSGSYPLTYSYDLMGNRTSIKEVTANWKFSYQYDAAARPSTVTSSWVDSQHPASLFTADSTYGYFPNGALRKGTLGNNLTTTAAYSNRLQPCRMNVNTSYTYFTNCNDPVPTSGNIQDFCHGYNGRTSNCYSYLTGTSDNGNLMSFAAAGNQSFTRSYAYDTLNRLVTMTGSSGCTGLSWTYDAWANRTAQSQTGGTCYPFSSSANTKNQLNGYTYDAAGNIVNDLNHSYTYDTENRIIKVDGGSTATYVYDAEGQRVQTIAGSTTTDFVREANGSVISEYGPCGSSRCQIYGYIYLNGSLLAEYGNSTTYFVHSDHLGSTRLLTNMSGQVADSVDYQPFGEQISGGTVTKHKFTGKERDSESGLDDFPARYFTSSMGRWMTPDPMGGHVEDPQTLNRYAYARNNPVSITDPSGLDFYLSCQHTDSNGSTCQQMQVGTDKNGNAQMAWVQGVTGDNGFTATQIGNDANGNLVDRTTGTGAYTADVTGSGVQLSNNGGATSATGVFLNKDVDLSGTNQVQSYDTVVRAGNMPGFLFTFQNSKMEANQTAAGFFTFDGTMHDAGEVLNSAGFHYMGPVGLNWNHAEYRSWEDSSGRSGHFNLEWSKTNPLFNVPTVGDMHFGEHNPLQSPAAHLKELLQ